MKRTARWILIWILALPTLGVAKARDDAATVAHGLTALGSSGNPLCTDTYAVEPEPRVLSFTCETVDALDEQLKAMQASGGAPFFVVGHEDASGRFPTFSVYVGGDEIITIDRNYHGGKLSGGQRNHLFAMNVGTVTAAQRRDIQERVAAKMRRVRDTTDLIPGDGYERVTAIEHIRRWVRFEKGAVQSLTTRDTLAAAIAFSTLEVTSQVPWPTDRPLEWEELLTGPIAIAVSPEPCRN